MSALDSYREQPAYVALRRRVAEGTSAIVPCPPLPEDGSGVDLVFATHVTFQVLGTLPATDAVDTCTNGGGGLVPIGLEGLAAPSDRLRSPPL